MRQKFFFLLVVLCGTSRSFPAPAAEDERNVRFDRNSNFCLNSAKEVHGARDPNAEVNHYLTCLVKKTRTQDQADEDPEVGEISATLSKILDNPLFREDIENPRARVLKRSTPPQLDEKLVAALARNPEALKLVSDFLERQKNKKKAEEKTIRQRNRPRKTSRIGLNAPKRTHFRQTSPIVQAERRTSSERDVDNPMINGNPDRNLEYFGPGDFRPERPFKLPRPATAQTLPAVLPWQIGYVPIPR